MVRHRARQRSLRVLASTKSLGGRLYALGNAQQSLTAKVR